MWSVWEKQDFQQYDVIVLGAGIVGLSTACYLKEHFPQHRVLVMERGLLPSGASTRNAGFACIGSASELWGDLQTHDLSEVMALAALRYQGLQRLRTWLGDTAIGYATQGSHELIFEHNLDVLDELDYLNEALFPILGKKAFVPASSRILEKGFNPQQVKALIENTSEGELDSGRLMYGLLQKTLQAGIEVKTGCRVVGFEEHASHVDVMVSNPLSEETLPFRTDTLVICTNAFTKDLLPGYAIEPGRGQVLLTHPIPGLPFRGIYHYEQGYFYFREYHGSILFGGGRHLAREEETTTKIALNNELQSYLEQQLREVIIPGHDFQVAMRWAGIMAFGPERKPIVKFHSDRILMGVRMGGMGVAIGTEIANQLANLYAERYG